MIALTVVMTKFFSTYTIYVIFGLSYRWLSIREFSLICAFCKRKKNNSSFIWLLSWNSMSLLAHHVLFCAFYIQPSIWVKQGTGLMMSDLAAIIAEIKEMRLHYLGYSRCTFNRWVAKSCTCTDVADPGLYLQGHYKQRWSCNHPTQRLSACTWSPVLVPQFNSDVGRLKRFQRKAMREIKGLKHLAIRKGWKRTFQPGEVKG